MADYHSHIVIQPSVPLIDMSPLEDLLLTHMLQSEEDADALYLFAELSVDSMPSINAGELRTAYRESLGFESQILPAVKLWIDKISEVDDAEDTDIDFDAHVDYPAYQLMLQDIVRRSATVNYFTIEGAYTCTKMRPDGFGGIAGLVHAAGIRVQGTGELIESYILEAGVTD